MTDETREGGLELGAGYHELDARFPDAVFSESFGQVVCRVPRETLVAFVDAAVEQGFSLFVDLCAVDYLRRDPRFEVVVSLLSLAPPRRLRILVGAAGRVPPLCCCYVRCWRKKARVRRQASSAAALL